MLTALNIEDRRGRGLYRAIHALRRNRIRTAHHYCDSAAVKWVTYEQYRRRVSWGSLDRFIKGERRNILCPPDLRLPEEAGYRRFVSSELSERLCENAALMLTRRLRDRRLRVALFDRSGERLGLCRYLADDCGVLDVVTDAVSEYLDEADALLCDKGAVVRVHRCADILSSADLVIAPAMIEVRLPAKPSSLILTGSHPTTPQNGVAVYDYFIELPAKYKAIKPPFLDDTYFASALYTLARAHEIGAYQFRYCSDGVTVHTPDSLTQLFLKLLSAQNNAGTA